MPEQAPNKQCWFQGDNLSASNSSTLWLAPDGEVAASHPAKKLAGQPAARTSAESHGSPAPPKILGPLQLSYAIDILPKPLHKQRRIPKAPLATYHLLWLVKSHKISAQMHRHTSQQALVLPILHFNLTR